MENCRLTGALYEEKASVYLESKEYIIIERNYRCKLGEIDIIAKKDDYLVFIEVKYRKNNKMGVPAQAVDFRKQQRIRNTARYYLMIHHYGGEQPCRFDVVSILGEVIDVYENAFI